MDDFTFALGMFLLCAGLLVWELIRIRRYKRSLIQGYCSVCRKPMRLGDTFKRDDSGEKYCRDCSGHSDSVRERRARTEL